MSRNVFVIGVFAVALSAGACGSSSGGGSGGASGSGGKSGSGGASGTGTGGASGTESEIQKACRVFCMSEETHHCHSDPATTVEKCMSYRCAATGEPNSHEAPATCASAWTAYYKCLTAQQAAGTANPDEPSKPGCQEPGTCETEAAALPNAHCP